ncbi:hypothetical protein AN958_02582, partial [Leucoagaricus sp. SymC.cos]
FPFLMITMSKPTYLTIFEYSPTKAIIIFICSFTSKDILTHCTADNKPDQFLNIKLRELEKYLEQVFQLFLMLVYLFCHIDSPAQCMNLNYYKLYNISHQYLSDHLSKMVENALSTQSVLWLVYLYFSTTNAIENKMDLSAFSLGIIAAYYNISGCVEQENSYPTLNMSYELAKGNYTASSPIFLKVTLIYNVDEDKEDTDKSVIMPFYPFKKLINGLSLKIRIVVKLEFMLPKATHQLRLYIVCNSYVGTDHDIELELLEIMEGEESDSDKDMESDEHDK